jgi:hypothetical protein
MPAGDDSLFWKCPHPTRDQHPGDVLSMRLNQAEALATLMVGEEFNSWADGVRHNIAWLLSGLITEARIAADEESKA